MPSTTRPPVMWSAVISRRASSAGWWTVSGETIDTRRRRGTATPTDASIVQHSKPGPSATAEVAGVRHVVVGVPERVEAVRLGPAGAVDHLVPGAVERGPHREVHGRVIASVRRHAPSVTGARRQRPAVGGPRPLVDRRVHRRRGRGVRGADPPAGGRGAARRGAGARRRLWRRAGQPARLEARSRAGGRGRPDAQPDLRGPRARWRPGLRAWAGGEAAVRRRRVRRRRRLPRVRAHRRRRRGDRRGGPRAPPRRAVLLLPQPPAAADAEQRLDRRPVPRPARAVLADRRLPRRGRDDRGGRQGRVHPLRPSPARPLRQRAGRQRPADRADGRARPARRLPRPCRGVRRREHDPASAVPAAPSNADSPTSGTRTLSASQTSS